MNSYDREHFKRASEGDWFTSLLLRLMLKADTENMVKLAHVYPDEARAALTWRFGFIPNILQSFLGEEIDEVVAAQINAVQG